MHVTLPTVMKQLSPLAYIIMQVARQGAKKISIAVVLVCSPNSIKIKATVKFWFVKFHFDQYSWQF